MRVRVLFFGVLREAVGCAGETLELGEGADAGAAVQMYKARCPQLGELWGRIAVAVNERYAAPGTRLRDGDELALLPPVSGGAPEPAFAAMLTHAAIDVGALLAEVKAGPDGAVVVFDGVVRNNTRGRQTLFLEYEAFEPMALAELRAVAEQALTQFAVREVRVVHRLGRLQIGETSVAIVVASAHRGAAFDACRFVIDTLKRTVPIWKKEHFVDGAVWADGEPFPAALTGGEAH